ncbi:hypothetical protein EVAR_24643_1 [Eumeta japonica]|uniref:Uncharacterized protein n=1 Tax=Eumeta variegata TaxID=151549 RepID=A0A4C1V1S9_EUMVA|nr:hypothetical protein EVAR_24643_1 [Eumeta japonica]
MKKILPAVEPEIEMPFNLCRHFNSSTRELVNAGLAPAWNTVERLQSPRCPPRGLAYQDLGRSSLSCLEATSIEPIAAILQEHLIRKWLGVRPSASVRSAFSFGNGLELTMCSVASGRMWRTSSRRVLSLNVAPKVVYTDRTNRPQSSPMFGAPGDMNFHDFHEMVRMSTTFFMLSYTFCIFINSLFSLYTINIEHNVNLALRATYRIVTCPAEYSVIFLPLTLETYNISRCPFAPTQFSTCSSIKVTVELSSRSTWTFSDPSRPYSSTGTIFKYALCTLRVNLVYRYFCVLYDDGRRLGAPLVTLSRDPLLMG